MVGPRPESDLARIGWPRTRPGRGGRDGCAPLRGFASRAASVRPGAPAPDGGGRFPL